MQFTTPIDMSLPVHPYVKKGSEKNFYRCPFCKGWIKGQPCEAREDSAGILAGRRGVSITCIRCGSELDFQGVCF